MPSSSIIRFLPRGLFPSMLPSITSLRRLSCLRTWPIHFIFLLLMVFNNLLSTPALLNTSSFDTRGDCYRWHVDVHQDRKTISVPQVEVNHTTTWWMERHTGHYFTTIRTASKVHVRRRCCLCRIHDLTMNERPEVHRHCTDVVHVGDCCYNGYVDLHQSRGSIPVFRSDSGVLAPKRGLGCPTSKAPYFYLHPKM